MRNLQGSPLQTFRWQTFKWLKKVIQGFECRMKAEELGGKTCKHCRIDILALGNVPRHSLNNTMKSLYY